MPTLAPFVLWCALLVACLVGPIAAATPVPTPPPAPLRAWKAQWIAHPTDPGTTAGVYFFRRDLTLPSVPATCVVQVSADNRFRLYVNGRSVGIGPARGDLLHWRYETIDLAPFLTPGVNTIAAEVWNGGEARAVAQMSARTAFILQAEGAMADALNTGPAWRVQRDLSRSFVAPNLAALQTYLVVGEGDRIEGRERHWSWATEALTGADWLVPQALGQGFPHGTGSGSPWLLVPNRLPAPEERLQRFARVRRCDGDAPPAGWLKGETPWVVPARTRRTVLLDQNEITTAYLELVTTGGAGAHVRLHYAEALIDAQRRKGHRDAVEGRHLLGVGDDFRPDGGQGRLFTTLWYRAYRYVELEIETAAEPLVIEDIRARFTAYPFEEKASFASSDPTLSEIWRVGWHTARLCAFETYMDCPYYEQLQYVGDTRLQALVSLYVSGDDRLMRNAIELYEHSRLPEGLIQSRYPSAVPQVINTFSLAWVEMICDYDWHRDDPAFVQRFLPGLRATLDWFAARVDARTGLLGPLPYWSFVDWPDEWAWDPVAQVGGVPDGAVEGGSSIITLQYALALRRAADVFEAFGLTTEATHARELATERVAAVRHHCWDSQRSYFSDTPEKRRFSQHANALAVLAGAANGDEARSLMQRTVADASLIACSQYFRFFLLRAMKQAGLGETYVAELAPWRAFLTQGFTTFPERQGETRSDCHAWSSSPNYELLATVCGIEPASRGFRTVRIAPHLGGLTWVEGRLPHPAGELRVSIDRREGKALVHLPPGVTGEWQWRGRSIGLHSGTQTLPLD